jgi:hypothetical protein
MPDRGASPSDIYTVLVAVALNTRDTAVEGRGESEVGRLGTKRCADLPTFTSPLLSFPLRFTLCMAAAWRVLAANLHFDVVDYLRNFISVRQLLPVFDSPMG